MSNSNIDPSESESDDLQEALLAAFGDEANDWLDGADDDGIDDEQLAAILAGQAGGETSEDSFTRQRPIDAILAGLTAQLEAVLNGTDSTETSNLNQDVRPRFVVFEVSDQVFGIPLAGVREIDRCGKVTVLPRTPVWLRGVTNLRGEILSVTDFRNLLDLPGDRQSASERIIVVHSERHGARTALVVDRVLGIRHLSVESKPLVGLSDRIANFADSVSVTDQTTTVLIDLDELFGCDELKQFTTQGC